MPRPAELAYYAGLIAGLTVTAARAKPDQLAGLHRELADAFEGVFVLLAHDADIARPTLDGRLLARASA